MEVVKAEALRYMGHRGQDISPDMDSMLDGCLEECRAVFRPRFVWRSFSLCGEGALPEGTLPLQGEDIRRHLEKAREAALLALTLGAEASGLIRRWQYKDMTRALMLDACADALVEELAEQAQREIEVWAAEQGLRVNFRYSPGYGDYPLRVQPALLELLDARRRIGLTCTESFILLPEKSVTAVLGLLPEGEPVQDRRGCEHCPKKDTCAMKRRDCGEPYRSS